MDWIQLFSYPFIQKAFLAGFLLSIITGFLSFFVVTKNLAFIGTGIAHIAFGGIALGIFLDLSPYGVSLIFCLLAGWLIAFFSFKKNLNTGSLIGVILAFSMALGLILIKIKTQNQYAVNASSYLFGSILSITALDLGVLTFLMLLLVFFFVFFKKEIVLMIFDPVYGQAIKMPIQKIYIFLVLILAGAVLSMVKIIGAVLVEGLLVLPALTASLWAKNYKQQLGFSFLFSALALFIGLFISATPLEWPPGASVIASGFFFFLLSFLLKKGKF